MSSSRRTSSILLSLILVSGAAVTPAAATPPLALWERPGYGPEDSYFNPGESTIVASSVGHLSKRWSVKARDIDESCAGFGPPLLHDRRLFINDWRGISAYSTETGAVEWTFDWTSPLETTPPSLALDGGILLAATTVCRPSDTGGDVTALDAGTGRTRWKLPVGLINSMVVDKGVIAIASNTDVIEESDAEVNAYATSDRRLLWSKPRHLGSGVSADGVILLQKVNDHDKPLGETTAVAIDTGAALWTRKGAWFALAADPDADRFYALNEGRKLAALNVADGRVLWTAPTTDLEPDEWSVLLAADRKRIYRAYNGAIEAFDAGTGAHLWTTKLTGEAQQPVLAGGLIYTGGAVLNTVDGKVVGPSFTGSVVVAGGRLYQVDQQTQTLTAYAP